MSRTKFRVRVTAIVAATVALTTALPAMAATGAKPAPPPSSGSLDGKVDGVVDVTQSRVRAYAGSKQMFAYNNEIIYWSVTGVRPNTASGTKNADLSLYADTPNKTLLAKSAVGGSAIDFVAVDSNYAPAPNTWYPTVTSKGTGTYDIQNDTDEGLLTCSLTLDVKLVDTDLIWVVDSYVAASTEATLTLTGGGDAQIFVMQAKASQQDTWYQSRDEALAVSDGTDGPETVTFVGNRDYYGVVIVQRAGSGPYQLNQDCRPANPTIS